MGKERRKSPRFDVNQMVKLSHHGKESFVGAMGLNISDTGILCETNQSLELYSRVFLMLSLVFKHESLEITCEGIVMRSVKDKKVYDVGIEFTAMREEDAAKLQTFLDYLNA